MEIAGPSGSDETRETQKRLYFLLDKLQEMARDLPASYQMRIPYELLSSLANCLLNDMIFEIVIGLMEIQQVTEKHFFQQRQQVLNQHKLDIKDLVGKKLPNEEYSSKYAELQGKHEIKMKSVDTSLVLQLDQKVKDQQETLEQAGIPGFYCTNNPVEIKVQMHLLSFILRLKKTSK